MNEPPKPCWICGEPATTGEHQLKKTDLIKFFVQRALKGVVKSDYDSQQKIKIQGLRSKSLKYLCSLCEKCNNERTQSYDLAYDELSDYVRETFSAIKKQLLINTNIVFGKAAAKNQQRNLFLYFIKAFGCQLNNKGLSVPEGLSEALLGKNYDNTFRVSVCLNQELQEFLQNFPLKGDQDAHGRPIDYFWAQDNGWFTVVHAYNRSIPAEFGEEWFGKSRRFRLGIWEASNNALKSDLGDAARPSAP